MIRYYLSDGTAAPEAAYNAKAKQFLYAPGDKPVIIAAPEALRLGLHDWMVFKPPRGNYPEVFERESLRRFSPAPPGEQDLWR
jgi:hypothetical protein